MTTIAIDGRIEDPARRPHIPGEAFVCWGCTRLLVPTWVEESQPLPVILPIGLCRGCRQKATGR